MKSPDRARGWLLLLTAACGLTAGCGPSGPANPPERAPEAAGQAREADPHTAPGQGATEGPDRSLAPRWSAPEASLAQDCAECHADQVDSWRRTGMARALSPVFAEEFEGLGQVADANYTYGFQVQPDGRPVIVERSKGAPDHRQEAELAYAIGAGELDRAFVALRGEFEWFAPLEIVSAEGGRHAALAPGHMSSPDLRFGVPITPECLGCHTDAPPPQNFPLNLHQPEWTPRGISCAACHGEVDAHADLRRGETEGTPADDPVLRIGQLTRNERMSICAACHLQGDSRIALDGDLGIPAPGGDLLEQRAIFVEREPSADIGFVSHTARLVLSECYVQATSMACDTCHDPHRTLFEETERNRVRAACQTCHAGDLELPEANASSCSRPSELLAAGRDCVDCHMRKTPTFDVAEVEIHDHFIRRHPGAPSPHRRPRTLESPNADWKRFAWPDGEAPDHVDDPGLWLMALAHRGQPQRAAQRIEARPGPKVARIPMYHHSVGSLLEQLGRPDLAVPAYERALALEPGFEPSAINLGRLYGTGGDPALGIGLLSRVIARRPGAVNAYRNRAALRGEIGDDAGFETDLLRAFELQPSHQLAVILADWYESSGRSDQAAPWRTRADRLTPPKTRR